jgi:demethylmenaquinone methyltransferase/2-methoxy-6-polyprenyl-1,4-benzoquinol methylase
MALTLPRGEAKRRTVEAMFDRIAPRYDLLNGVISLGSHRGWKRAAVAALGLEPGALVVDLACGTGDLAAESEARGLRAIGVDVSAGMLAVASRRRAASLLVRGNGEALPFADGAVDGVTCGFALRNFVAIDAVLGEIGRVLRPGGRAAFLEVDRPRSRPVAWAHGIYFDRVVPLLGAALSDPFAYSYLPSSAAYLPSEAALRAMMGRAGLVDVAKRRLLAGAAQLLVAARAGGPA